MRWETKVCFLRVLVVLIIALIWLIGGAIFGVSLWLLLDYWINQYVSATDELKKYTIAIYIFIAFGASVIVFGIIGIYGAARPRRWALIIFDIYLSLMVVLMISGAVIAYVYREEVEREVRDSQLLQRVLQNDYGRDNRVTSAFDFMQKELHCCGGVGYTDYNFESWKTGFLNQDKVNNYKNYVPNSCCKSDGYLYDNVPDEDYKFCPMYKITQPNKNEENDNVYKKGCGQAIVDFFKDNIGKISLVAISILILQILCIILMSILIHTLRRVPLPQSDDVVYEMARTQEKSPYPTRGGGPYANLYNN